MGIFPNRTGFDHIIVHWTTDVRYFDKIVVSIFLYLEDEVVSCDGLKGTLDFFGRPHKVDVQRLVEIAGQLELQ